MKRTIQDAKALFSKNQVMNLESIQAELGNRSRIGVMRDLNKIGYHSSYNMKGKYYTLAGIPQFDKHGLWKCGEALFSVHGSLINTLKHYVNNSSRGYTHWELKELLGDVNLHNTLLLLVKSNEIQRTEHKGNYVYTSKDSATHISQIENRKNLLEEDIMDLVQKESNPANVIMVLRAVIACANETPSAVIEYLSKKGIKIRSSTVEAVFERYKLGCGFKKNAFASSFGIG